MHIILGALATIVTILILVNRLSESGIDIGWLNPFAWRRRRAWSKQYHANPLYSLTSPMEVTALFMVGLAKSEGEISSDQKNEIKRKFQEVFNLSEQKATELFTSSAFLLKDDPQVIRDVRKIIGPSQKNFTGEQVESAAELLSYIANFDSPADGFQRDVIDAFAVVFDSGKPDTATW